MKTLLDKPHFITSRDLVKAQLPNNRHNRKGHIAGWLAFWWDLLLGR